MKPYLLIIPILMLFFSVIEPSAEAQVPSTEACKAQRDAFKTTLKLERGSLDPLPTPPQGVLEIISYPSQVGPLGAYLTPDPKDGKKHPAIVWITGGFSNALGEMWGPQSRANDQTASAYRDAGIVTLYPTLRGGNDNPGQAEGFFGEVDDILSAADYLATLPYVDPDRIYLGGHSTGGTLVLLVASYDDRFAGVFSFGPTASVASYGDFLLGQDPETLSEDELIYRSPFVMLNCASSPVFVIEGDQGGNADDFPLFAEYVDNSYVELLLVKGATHFSILAPSNEIISAKIMDGGDVNLSADELEISFD